MLDALGMLNKMIQDGYVTSLDDFIEDYVECKDNYEHFSNPFERFVEDAYEYALEDSED